MAVERLARSENMCVDENYNRISADRALALIVASQSILLVSHRSATDCPYREFGTRCCV